MEFPDFSRGGSPILSSNGFMSSPTSASLRVACMRFCLSSAPAAVGLKALKADLAALKPPSAICPVPMGAQPLRKPKVASPRMIKGRLGKLFVFTLHLLRLLSAQDRKSVV